MRMEGLRPCARCPMRQLASRCFKRHAETFLVYMHASSCMPPSIHFSAFRLPLPLAVPWAHMHTCSFISFYSLLHPVIPHDQTLA